MLLALVFLGGLGFFWGMAMAIRDGRKGANESGVVGTVTEFELREQGPTDPQCQVFVHYTFEVEGKTYSGNCTEQMDRYKAEQTCASYGAGSLLVYYDPENPDNSWLQSKSGNIIVPLLVAGLGASIAGAALVFYTAA